MMPLASGNKKLYADRQGPLVTEKRQSRQTAGKIPLNLLRFLFRSIQHTFNLKNNEVVCMVVSKETSFSSVQLKHICNPGGRIVGFLIYEDRTLILCRLQAKYLATHGLLSKSWLFVCVGECWAMSPPPGRKCNWRKIRKDKLSGKMYLH